MQTKIINFFYLSLKLTIQYSKENFFILLF